MSFGIQPRHMQRNDLFDDDVRRQGGDFVIGAHALINIVAFVGYALLADRIPWLS